MSLGVVIKSPSGIVMAADSRVTLQVTNTLTAASFPVHYDNALKVLRFNPPHTHVAAVTYGQATIPGEARTVDGYLPELEAHLPKKRVKVEEYATQIARFFADQWPNPVPPDSGTMHFYVAGYDDGEPYGRYFEVTVPTNATPRELHANDFGIGWGGQREIVDRVIKGHEDGLAAALVARLGLTPEQITQLQQVLLEQQLSLPVQVMALQDCVDLAITLIRTTIRVQQLAIQLRGVGGPVDVVAITRTEGVHDVQVKTVHGGEGD